MGSKELLNLHVQPLPLLGLGLPEQLGFGIGSKRYACPLYMYVYVHHDTCTIITSDMQGMVWGEPELFE